MTENLPIKFLFLLAVIFTSYVGYSGLTAKNMLGLGDDCKKAVSEYKKFNLKQYSPEAKVAEAKMQTICKTMGQSGVVYLKSLGLDK